VERFAVVEPNRVTLLVEGEGEAGAPAFSASERGGETSVVFRQRGVALLEAGRVAEALADFEAATRLDPDDFAAWRFRLVALWRLRRGPELESAFGEVFRRFAPTLLVSRFALVLRETGYTELAARVFAEAVRRAPERADVWTALGNLAYERGEYVAAKAHYERALSLYPASLEALDNLGKIAAIDKDYPRAVAYLERALSLRPGFASALSTLGGVLVQQGDLERAADVLSEALRAASSDSVRINAFGNLGGLFLKRGDWDRAAECFEKVLALDPADAPAKRALEYLEAKRRGR
jgi:tetratricopeptide (TPR) repeat protein